LLDDEVPVFTAVEGIAVFCWMGSGTRWHSGATVCSDWLWSHRIIVFCMQY